MLECEAWCEERHRVLQCGDTDFQSTDHLQLTCILAILK